MAAPEVLPPKRQAVVDRLRRRIESYRRHQNDCIPRFDQTFNGVVEQNIQDTLVLKQRFLENKAKRTAKKSEKKPTETTLQNSVHSINKFSVKRNPSEEGEGNTETFSEPPPKKIPTSAPPPPTPQQPAPQSQPQSQENLTKFSVEIVQQLEFTSSSTNSQISSNVTVKALNTSIKSDPSQPSSSPRPSTPLNPETVECKQEPENPDFVDLEQCAAALEKDAAANGGNSFPGFSDLIGDDTSDAIITSDAFKDLISEISDFNSDFMKVFDFDGSENKPQIDNTPGFREEHENKNHSQNPRQQVQHNVIATNQRLNYNSSIDFSKAELSPAAQTLKQMAEQHQNKSQLGMNFNPTRPTTKSPYEFQFNSNGEFMHNQNGNQQNFKQGMSTPPCTFSADNIKQEAFSAQNSPVSFSPSGKAPSPQARLGPQFKQQYSPYGSPGTHGSPQYSSRQPTPNPGSNAQPPPRPSSQGSMQAQGQPINVSMAQNINSDIKNSSVTVGTQQAVYMGGSQETYCNVSQSQTMSFNQQPIRHAPPLRPILRPQHPQAVEMMSGQSIVGRADYMKNQGYHSMLRFTQPRMLSLQPMPPSGPMMRGQPVQFVNSSINPGINQARLGTYNGQRPLRLSTTLSSTDSPEWRQVLQQRPHLYQAQGVTFSSSNSQIPAGQVQQHMSRIVQQSLGLHHSTPQMGVGIQMSQSVASGTPFSSTNTRQVNSITQLPSYSTSNYPQSSTLTNSYPNFVSQHVQPTSFQQNSAIPSDFNLDFLEQIPSTDSSNFSEQELLNSLDGSSYLQDIL